MAGLLDDDYGAGGIAAGMKGFLTGLQQMREYNLRKDEMDESKRFREMEVEAKRKAEDQRIQTQRDETEYRRKKDEADQAFQREKFEFEKQKANKEGGGLPKEDSFTSGLRGDWLKDPTTRRTQEASVGFDKVQRFGKSGTAIGDMSLIFGYMKILDPGSTVREGEYAQAEQARGVPSSVLAAYNKALRGEKLTSEQRNEFVKQATQGYAAHLEQQKRFNSAFSDLATRKGRDPRDIVMDKMFLGLPPMGSEPPPVTQPAQASIGQSIESGINSLIGNKPKVEDIKMNDEDMSAYQWAITNPKNPKAQKIINGLKAEYGF